MTTRDQSIYMDYNASAPLLPAVKDAMIEVLEKPGNASSIHSHGRSMRSYVDAARREILEGLDARGAKLVFTGSATESNNMVLKCINAKSYIISAIEHTSLIQVREDVHHIPVDENGVIRLAALEGLLRELPAPALVSIMLVNNETGVIQPVEKAARLAHSYGAIVHTDAVQAIGKIPVSFHELDVDLMTIAAHKFGGPTGIAALIYRDPVSISPLLQGGGHEQGLRAGTQNISLIEGLRAALNESRYAPEKYRDIEVLRDKMEDHILSFCLEARVFGKNAKRAPNTSCISMPGVSAEVQLMAFDLAGISVSSGSACSSGKVRASHVMTAMGVDVAQTGGALRVSLGWNSNQQDVDAFVKTWKQIYQSNLKRS